MHSLEVSSVIDSILNAFSNGMDVFRKITTRKGRQNLKDAKLREEERRLQQSLDQGPKMIRAQYEQKVAEHGQRFRMGDAESHSLLAHTLLVMNASLIEVINHALSDDKQAKSSMRRSLLSLSEVAAAETLSALSQLSHRLKLSSQTCLTTRPKHSGHERLDSHGSPSTKTSKEQPARSPLLERGGWVRSKSGSTVVLAASARKRTVRKQEYQRSQSSPSPLLHNGAMAQDVCAGASQKSSTRDREPPSCLSSSSQHDYLLTVISNADSPPYTQQRPPSMLIVPADYFEPHPLESRSGPPRAPKIPTQPKVNQTWRTRPVSGTTFMTTSTKIGEIPEDRVADRVLSAEDCERIPFPYVIPPPLVEVPNVKRRGFRLWKKQPITAY